MKNEEQNSITPQNSALNIADVSRCKKPYFVWDGINSQLEEFEKLEDAKEFIRTEFCDSEDGIHPDIESVFIMKRIFNTEVKENANGFHDIVIEGCEG